MANDVKLQEGHPLDENLRPIKVDDESTPIEVSKEETKIDSDLEVTGEIKGSHHGANIPNLYGSGGSDGIHKVFAKNVIWYDHTTGNVTLSATEGFNYIKIHELGDPDDYFVIDLNTGDNGAVILATNDASGTNAHMTLDPDGDLIVSGADVKIDEGQKLYLDGGGDTYVVSTSDVFDIVVGGTMLVRAIQGINQKDWKFRDSAVGFDQVTASYHAVNTTIDFREGNKVIVTFGTGNITNLNCYFPNMSGNFLVLIKQDASGSRTIANYKAFDSAGNAAGGSSAVKFAGGSAPTLTTDANHVDIISFYWDATNEIAYAVPTLDFQF
jgi:hypothetical protein